MNRPARLVLCVDLDEWYHCRWATGSKGARWTDTHAAWKEVYGTDRPRGDIDLPTAFILEALAEKNIHATFFVLGEVASNYPHLVKQIAVAGHEVACHGYRHIDLWLHDNRSFRNELSDAKKLLEDLIGQPVLGYRAPNLIVEDWIMPILEDLGFLYDSSVCPSRRIMGKFGQFTAIPAGPYCLSKGSFQPGTGGLVEIPIPVFPLLRLPAASSIMTRVIGLWWSSMALRYSLKRGDSIYYCHPYEMGSVPPIDNLTMMQKLFLRRVGPWMKLAFKTLLKDFSDVEIVSCGRVAHEFLGNAVRISQRSVID